MPVRLHAFSASCASFSSRLSRKSFGSHTFYGQACVAASKKPGFHMLASISPHGVYPQSVKTGMKLPVCKYTSLPHMSAPHVTEEFRLVYEGPLTKSVKLIKMFSLSTAVASLMGGPVLVLFGKDSVSVLGKMILAGTVMLMGVSTTILLHWITRVYVHRMHFHPQTRVFAAETLSVFATTRTHFFSVEDIVVPQAESAFSTFEANGKKFFIHTELKEAQQILGYVKEFNMENLEGHSSQK